MKIIVDTNVLVRVLVRDDPDQALAAERVLREADSVVVSAAVLCEVVWVLSRVYRLKTVDIVRAIETLLAVDKLVINRTVAHAGLRMIDAGGDFADGVIASDGQCLGGEVFVSFDRKAVAAWSAQGQAAQLIET